MNLQCSLELHNHPPTFSHKFFLILLLNVVTQPHLFTHGLEVTSSLPLTSRSTAWQVTATQLVNVAPELQKNFNDFSPTIPIDNPHEPLGINETSPRDVIIDETTIIATGNEIKQANLNDRGDVKSPKVVESTPLPWSEVDIQDDEEGIPKTPTPLPLHEKDLLDDDEDGIPETPTPLPMHEDDLLEDKEGIPTPLPRREDDLLEDEEGIIPQCGYDVGEGQTKTGAGDYNTTRSQYTHHNISRLTPKANDARGGSASGMSPPSHSRVRRQAVSLHGPLWTDKDALFVELVVIADYSFCQKHGHYAIDRISRIVGVTNMIFEPLKVVVVLVDIQLWTSGDLVHVSAIKEDTLKSMQEYRQKMITENPRKPNDNLMLITRKLSKGSGGVALTSGMCSDYQSVNIVQDVDESVGVGGLFLAHEMGHNLNMKHDGDQKGKYRGCHNNGGYIMQPSLGSHSYEQNLSWSSCSKQYLADMKKTTDLQCLKNIPKDTYISTCGNGIVEDGEDCDCGPPELCKNKCCEARTCRFASQAQCASGACCNTATCRPKVAGTMCRQASGDCDLPEYCLGGSERCPDDVHKGDGAYCGYYSKGHCYKGKCGSHNEKCQRLWGYRASVASSECFDSLSERSDRHGNCGQDHNEQYVHCDSQSSMCGTLYCDNGGTGEIDISERQKYYENKKWVKSSMCQYIEGYITHYPMDIWLSPDGASCGNRKMCINQRCHQVTGSDDSLNCINKCSGRGICNSEGNCHCNPGYEPPDCSRPGSGGSYDSGPVGEGSSGRRPINPVTNRPDYNWPRGTTPTYRKPVTTRRRYDRPKATTPKYRRPRPTRPYYYWPKTTTPRPYYYWPKTTTPRPYYYWPKTTTPRYHRPWVPPVRLTTSSPNGEDTNEDNGRVKAFFDDPGVIAGVVILTIFLLLVTSLLIMCCLWDKIRSWWESSGRNQITPLAPKAALCIDNCFCLAVSKVIQWMVEHGPMGKLKKPPNHPEAGRTRKKSAGYKVDIEVKRISQPDPENPKQEPLLPSTRTSPALHHKSLEKILRPKYHQQISVDSGCIIDDHEEGPETPSTNVSMSSLVSAFRSYNAKVPKDSSQCEIQKPYTQDHQKEVSLRRLVTDPRSGHNSANHSLPYEQPPTSRHSLDASVNNKIKNKTNVPVNQNHFDKNNKNFKNLSSNSLAMSSKLSTTDSLPSVHFQQTNGKKPMMPPRKANTPPRVIPSKAMTPPRALTPREPPPQPPARWKNKAINKSENVDGKDANTVGRLNKVTTATRDSRFTSSTTNTKTEGTKKTTSGNKNVRNLTQKFENL